MQPSVFQVFIHYDQPFYKGRAGHGDGYGIPSHQSAEPGCNTECEIPIALLRLPNVAIRRVSGSSFFTLPGRGRTNLAEIPSLRKGGRDRGSATKDKDTS